MKVIRQRLEINGKHEIEVDIEIDNLDFDLKCCCH